jgi:hypothetical protein
MKGPKHDLEEGYLEGIDFHESFSSVVKILFLFILC